jgi:hypothetical protein
LFQSFSKSAREAARTAPVKGAGLALWRQHCRGLDGDPRLEGLAKVGAWLPVIPAQALSKAPVS